MTKEIIQNCKRRSKTNVSIWKSRKVMGKNWHQDQHADQPGDLLSMRCAEKTKLFLEKQKPDDKHDLDTEKA